MIAPCRPGNSPLANHQRILAIIFAVAIAFRCALIVTMPYLAPDSTYYDKIATNLALGNGFSLSDSAPYLETDSRPPLYPLFVSVIYRLFGLHNHTAVRLAQAVLDSFTCLLIFFIARIPFGAATALAASALVSVNPFTAIYTATLLREVLLTLLTTLTVWAALQVARNRSLGNCAVLGTVVGLAVLCKTILLLFPLLFFGWLFYSAPGKRQTLLCAALTMTIVAVVTVPWSMRERRAGGAGGERLLLSETGGIGAELYGGTFDYEYTSEEMVNHADEIRAKERARNPAAFSSTGNLHYAAMAWERIKLHPVRYLADRLLHLPRLWITNYGVNNSRILTGLASVACIIALLLGLIGIWLEKPRWKEAAPILLMMLYFELVYLPFHAEARYTVPVRPCLLIFAAVALLRAWRACGGAVVKSSWFSRATEDVR